MAKNFKQADTKAVYADMDNVTAEVETKEPPRTGRKARKTYSKREKEEALESLRTSGMKGVRLPRINLALTPSNYQFVKVMSKVRGQTMTELVNDIVRESRENHADVYDKALEFRDSL